MMLRHLRLAVVWWKRVCDIGQVKDKPTFSGVDSGSRRHEKQIEEAQRTYLRLWENITFQGASKYSGFPSTLNSHVSWREPDVPTVLEEDTEGSWIESQCICSGAADKENSVLRAEPGEVLSNQGAKWKSQQWLQVYVAPGKDKEIWSQPGDL